MRKWTVATSIVALVVASASLSACTDATGKAPATRPTIAAPVPTPASDPTSSSPARLSPAPRTSPSPSPKGTTKTGGTKAQKLDATAVMTIAAVDSSTGDVIVGGYVRGVIEANGACLFTVTSTDSGSAITVKTTGLDNSDSTSCGSAAIAAGKLSAGRYTVVLTYTNATGSTSSAPVVLKIS